MSSRAVALSGKRDRYGGVHVRLSATGHVAKMSQARFDTMLRASLTKWRSEGVRAVWLRLPTILGNFVGPAVNLGFVPHHARPDFGFMLTLWMGKGESKLPLYAHHTVGAAGVVLGRARDGQTLVLAIREKHGPTANLEDFWKLPGGAVDPREDIRQAAVREVLEETGIQTTFVSVVGLRETHAALYGATDIYCVCHLKVESDADGNLPTPVACTDEIAQAEWIPISKFLNRKYYTNENAYGRLLIEAFEVADANIKSSEGEVGLRATKLPSFGNQKDTIYCLTKAKL